MSCKVSHMGTLWRLSLQSLGVNSFCLVCLVVHFCQLLLPTAESQSSTWDSLLKHMVMCSFTSGSCSSKLLSSRAHLFVMQIFSLHQRLSAVSTLFVKLWLYWYAFKSDHVSISYPRWLCYWEAQVVVMVDLRTGMVQQNVPNVVAFQLQPSFRNHWCQLLFQVWRSQNEMLSFLSCTHSSLGVDV